MLSMDSCGLRLGSEAVCSWIGFASRLFTSAEGPAYQRNEHVDKDPDGPAVPH